MVPLVDGPKLLSDPQVRKYRREQLCESHIAPLTAFVEALRDEVGPRATIPDFDPWDGGIDAEILYLLEAPGPPALASGFISRNTRSCLRRAQVRVRSGSSHGTTSDG